MLRFALTGIITIVSVAPALAADFYIVRGPDKKCRIVETRPAEKTIVIVGDKAYTTRDEATKQMAVVCKDTM